jgi:hypothetical protein
MDGGPQSESMLHQLRGVEVSKSNDTRLQIVTEPLLAGHLITPHVS